MYDCLFLLQTLYNPMSPETNTQYPVKPFRPDTFVLVKCCFEVRRTLLSPEGTFKDYNRLDKLLSPFFSVVILDGSSTGQIRRMVSSLNPSTSTPSLLSRGTRSSGHSFRTPDSALSRGKDQAVEMSRFKPERIGYEWSSEDKPPRPWMVDVELWIVKDHISGPCLPGEG